MSRPLDITLTYPACSRKPGQTADMNRPLQEYPISAISDELQNWLLVQLWKPCGAFLKPASVDMTPYFNYYTKQCQRFSREGGIHICIKSHQDLVSICENILTEKNLTDATRDDVSSYIRTQLTGVNADSVKKVNATVDLCASLLVMAKIGVPEFSYSGSNHLTWSSPQTLRQAIERHFQPERQLQPDNPRLGRHFTARNLSSMCGIKIAWTSNIIDHLLLSDDDQTVFIFHQCDFLRYQQWYGPSLYLVADNLTSLLSFTNPIFPDLFIDETLRTIALLFPQNDGKSRRWLRGQISKQSLDPSIAQCGNLRAQNRRFAQFCFWHDRLIILKQAFDESKPRELTHWWNDQRNSVQWYTFWVAILVFVMTLFFGLVQSIEGALQVYLSWKALAREGS